MKVKNLTSKIQEQKIITLVGGREISIYIEPNSTTEIIGAYILDKSKFDEGILEFVDEEVKSTKSKLPEKKIEEKIDEGKLEKTPDGDTPPEDPDDGDDEDEDETTNEPTVADEKFICPECGAEFASERGLNSHMSRVHSKSE